MENIVPNLNIHNPTWKWPLLKANVLLLQLTSTFNAKTQRISLVITKKLYFSITNAYSSFSIISASSSFTSASPTSCFPLSHPSHKKFLYLNGIRKPLNSIKKTCLDVMTKKAEVRIQEQNIPRNFLNISWMLLYFFFLGKRRYYTLNDKEDVKCTKWCLKFDKHTKQQNDYT